MNRLKLLFSNDVIEFYCNPELEGIIPPPVSAAKKIPEWWKRLGDTFDKRDSFGAPSMTAKKCMPLLDCMSLGYIIPLQGDLHVITNDDRSIIKVTNTPNLAVAEFHAIAQVGGRKNAPGAPADPIKFINHWIIKTAPGWSCLFVPPINHMRQDFTCLGGVVDTDRYPKEVNFPAIWHANNFDDKVPAGTPLVQVIPFKRDSFPKKPKVRPMKEAEFKEINRISKTQLSRAHYYSKELREPRK